MEDYGAFAAEYLGMDSLLKWEDGKTYPLPQDYANMMGWEELAERVGRLYNALPKEQQASCMILTGNYGHAGALIHHADQYQLPKNIQSLSSSFMLWADEQITYDNQFLILDVRQDSSDWFYQNILVDSIQTENAGDPGYIYYRTAPKLDVSKAWHDLVIAERQLYLAK